MLRPLMFACFTLHTCCALVAAGEGASSTRIGTAIPDFTILDYRGRAWTFTELTQHPVTVFAFLGTECPLAKLYGPRLQQLADKNPHVGFVGINSNRHDSITEIAGWARRHEVKFPVLKDVGNRVADAFHAQRTPEIFVVDDQRVVRYHGRVDDQYGVGYVRDDPRRRDLQEAIEELLAGKPVSVAETAAVGCHIGRIRKAQDSSDVTYSNQIARILQKRCLECHRAGDIAPFALTEYDEVVGWADTIREVINDNRMPPWHVNPEHGRFSNDRHLSDEEKSLINKWVKAGAPRGNPDDLPEPMEFVEGWQLPREPDLVVHMRDEPFDVPAEGVVRYQNFRVDPGFAEDKWIQAAEVVPGNRAVVHHILVFAIPPKDRRIEGAGGGAFLAGYVPGLRALNLDDGLAQFVPAGSQLRFQVHYTPIGTPQEDRSLIGLVFAKDDEVKQVLVTHEIHQHRFRIPPGAANHRVEATSPASPIDLQLLGLMPHMHLRGKAFRYEALYPDGKSEVLLDVPAYDFNWQTSYRLAEPKTLPAQTRIRCVAHFDNSGKNVHNPDPTKTVRWGDQTWDEMMIGYIDLAIPRSAVARKSDDAEVTTTKASQMLQLFDKNSNGQIERSEVSRGLIATFELLDTNDDDIVTLEELKKLAKLKRR